MQKAIFTQGYTQIPKRADNCILLTKTYSKSKIFQINSSNFNKDKNNKEII